MSRLISSRGLWLILIATVSASLLLPSSSPAIEHEAQAICDLQNSRARVHTGASGQAIRAIAYPLDATALDRVLRAAPRTEFGWNRGVLLSVPTPAGEPVEFRVVERPTLSPSLQASRPELRTYVGYRVDDPTVQIRITRSGNEFYARVLGRDGWTWQRNITEGREELLSWSNAEDPIEVDSQCDVETGMRRARGAAGSIMETSRQGLELRTYRLAVSGTGEFTQFHGSVSNAESQITTLINLANEIFERDLAVRMEIVDLNVYSNPLTDPFTNASATSGQLLTENHDALVAKLGLNGFDLGHVVGQLAGGGWQGLASIGAQCSASSQGRGATLAGAPNASSLAIGILHEMGHQLGASHSFNGTLGSCGGSRFPDWAFEIGSGVSIMSYAGTCDLEDVVGRRLFMYNAGSMESIASEIASKPFCGTAGATGNDPPVADAGNDYTIPQETAFVLDGSGSTDPGPDALTFSWEQHDLGPASPPYGPGAGPLFHNFLPVDGSLRSVPEYARYRTSGATPFEFLPTVDRLLTFRLVVRDNFAGAGGTAWDTSFLTVSGAPFRIVSPNGGETAASGEPFSISWQVGGGSVATDVRMLFSSDSGVSWTEIEASTPNDGSHTLNLPCATTTEARIRIEAVGNIFFDITDLDFEVEPDQMPPSITCPSPFSVVATSPSGIDKDDPALAAWIASVQTSDNCDADPAVTFAAAQTIPIGVNPLGFTVVDDAGNLNFCLTELTVTESTAAPEIAGRTAMLGIHPNPFNPRTTIRFRIGRTQPTRLEILDVKGRRVAVLFEGSLEDGPHELTWDGSNAASGVYFARLVTEDGSFHRRMALLK